MSDTELRLGRRQQWAADGLLLMVTAIWGSTFVMVKDAVAAYPVFPFLALRFGLGTIALLLIGWRRLRTLDRSSRLAGALAGLFLLGGYAFQTLGLQYTSASRAGFITGLSVVLVPLISALVIRTRPQPAALVGVALATIGLMLFTSGQKLSLSPGDLLVLVGALCFACHIVTVGLAAPGADPIALTIVQLAVVAVASAGIAQVGAQWAAPTPATWGAAAFTGILATAVAFGLQTSMQRFTSSIHTALIFTAEPVFAALFGVLLDKDLFTARMATGGALILLGALASEISWSERTAGFVSRFLAPHYVLGICLVLLGLNDPDSWRVGIKWVLFMGLPALLLVLGVFSRALRNGTISDWHVSDRRQRLSPVLIVASLLLSGFPALLLYWFDGPRMILGATVAAFLLIILNLLITAFWKISQHVSAISLCTTVLTASFGIAAAPSLLLIPMVAWARIRVDAHTTLQTMAGAVTGMAVGVITLQLLGLT
ncbi:MAG: DMT family transporter [Anaerolineae bacterium]